MAQTMTEPTHDTHAHNDDDINDLGLYGLMAEFATAEELIEATRQTAAAGYKKFETHTPYPIHELAEAQGLKRTRVPELVFIGGLVGLIAGFALQWWINLRVYPMNIGGKPLNSWPAFVVPAYEMTILFAAGAAVVGMLMLNGLPRPYHPVFNVKSFERASQDRFFLAIEATDPQFNEGDTRRFLASLGAEEVSDVPN